MKNSLNKCGCDGGGGGDIQITTSDVTYNGANEICIPLNGGANLTAILQAIDAIICQIRDQFEEYYTSEQVDSLLEDYAKLQDLLSSGEVQGKNLVFSNDSGPVFSVDASAFLAQGVTLTYVDGTLRLLDEDGNQLSSVYIASGAASLKTTLEVTGPLTINWDGTVPSGGQTFREKHGEDFVFQAYRTASGVEISYNPTVAITRNGSGNITQVEFADVFPGRIIII